MAIAEEFNNHFAKIGKSLAESFDDCDSNDFLSYLKDFSISSIYMQPTTPQKILMMISLMIRSLIKPANVMTFFLSF